MSREEILLNVLNTLVDDRIDMYGYVNTIEFLIDQGIPEDLLINDLGFDADDVQKIVKGEYESEVDFIL